MPDELAAYRDTWAELHPDWELRLWGEADLGWLRNIDLFRDAEAVTPHVGQFRADVARYEILHRFGGVYVDCDMECRRPIDPLMGFECWAAWETDGVWVNNAVMGCVPGHPLMVALIDGLPGNVKRTFGKRPNVLSGPQYLTPLAIEHGIEVRPSAEFFPYRWDELERGNEDFPDAYGVHHWNNRRKLKGVPRG